MSKILLDGKTLNGIKAFCGTEKSRPFLSGVYFDYRKKTKDFVIVATNGHVLSICNGELGWDGKPFKSFILPMKDILNIGRGVVYVAIDTNKNRISFLKRESFKKVSEDDVLEQGISKKYTPIDLTYPDYMKIFPKAEDLEGGSLASFNPMYLSLFSKIVTYNSPVTLFLNKNEHEPSVVRYEDEFADFVFLLMPRRDKTHDVLPSWL